MDKRYFLIIVILVFSFISLYIIYDASNIVGSASVDFNEYTFSLPSNFELFSSDNEYLVIYNRDLGKIVISYEDIDSKNDYNQRLQFLKNRSDMSIVSNGTINVNDIVVYSIFYQKNSSTGTVNQSSFIFKKYDKLFTISLTDFDYNKRDQAVNVVSFLVESLRPNYEVGST